MKIKAMTAVSMLALMISVSAHAADIPNAAGGEAVASTAPATGSDDTVMDDVKSGAHKTGNAIHNASENIEAFFIGKQENKTLEPILIHRSMTADGLIGESVINSDGQKIATVKDVIIDKNGKAILIVVSDNGVLGIGSKVAAFDYSQVVAQDSSGNVSLALSKNMVDHAADFSYDQKDWAKAKVIPRGSISVNALLQGDVLDNKGKKVASIENVYLRNADVSQVIVGFDKTLGMGGKLAALDFDNLQIVKKRKDIDFKLTSNQAAQFKSFEKSVAN